MGRVALVHLVVLVVDDASAASLSIASRQFFFRYNALMKLLEYIYPTSHACILIKALLLMNRFYSKRLTLLICFQLLETELTVSMAGPLSCE